MKRLVSIAIIVVLLALCACSPAKRIVGGVENAKHSAWSSCGNNVCL